jgi:hypothetical protein
MTKKFPSQLPADATIAEIVAGIVLPPNMPVVPHGIGGVVASAIRTPCCEPCLNDVVYVGFHLVPCEMVGSIYLGCDDRDLIAALEQATRHQPIGHCLRCGAVGRETASAELAHLSHQIDLGCQADDEFYEHLAVWLIRAGEPRWTTIYLHWNLGWRPTRHQTN